MKMVVVFAMFVAVHAGILSAGPVLVPDRTRYRCQLAERGFGATVSRLERAPSDQLPRTAHLDGVDHGWTNGRVR